jgi:hypothetical protein
MPPQSNELDVSRKSSLVQGELADLEALRQEQSTSTNNVHKISKQATSWWEDLDYNLKVLRQNPRILILSFLVFAILCGGGLGLVFFLAGDQDEDEKDAALDLAIETGRWFCKF